MVVKIALFGATGRFGGAIASRIGAETDLLLVEAIAHAHSPSLGKEIGGCPVSAAFANEADLLIDVSIGFPTALEAGVSAGKPIVVGSTGIEEALLREAAESIPVFYAANFSLGVAVFKKLVVEAARLFGGEADLIEKHHAMKRDAPSGTARWVAGEMERFVKPKIHSIRAGAIVGEHSVLLSSPEERIEITHIAQSRDAGARGALEAARFLARQKPGLYGMHDLLV